jgi:hypothetical protein
VELDQEQKVLIIIIFFFFFVLLFFLVSVSWFGLGSNKELEAVYLEECPDAQKDDLDKVIREKEAFFLSELKGDGWTAINLNDKPGTSNNILGSPFF